MHSSKVIGNSPEVLNFNHLFFKLNRFICNQLFGSPRSLPSSPHWRNSTKTTPTMPCKYSFERSFKILKKLKKVLHKIYSNNNHIGAPWCPHSRNSNSSQQKLLQQCLKHVPWQLFSCSCQDPQNFDIKIPLALAWKNLHQEPPCWKGKCLRDITALKPFFINF